MAKFFENKIDQLVYFLDTLLRYTFGFDIDDINKILGFIFETEI